MSWTRRRFVGMAAAAMGFGGLRRLIHPGAAGGGASALAAEVEAAADPSGGAAFGGFGPLVEDPYGVLDLPEGFSYHVISKVGERMDDGLYVPGMHDGMGAFAGPGGGTILVRNHELTEGPLWKGAFGWTNELFGGVERSRCYDPGHGRTPMLGGTTTLVYDRRRLVRHHLSLACTGRNCAGGPTPWGSWLTCEEWTQRADDKREKDHGYVFEVPAEAEGLVEPVPLKGMGRFNHEATAVDPASGVVYLTEDRGDGLLYRYVPARRGRLAAGGRLEALAVRERDALDTRNYVDNEGALLFGPAVEVGRSMAVRWVALEEVEAPRDDLRFRGFAAGAARFARGEGMWEGGGSIYFACTTGGAKQLGQVWRYAPSEHEGTGREEAAPGRLELFVEPNDGTLVENADNLTVAPWGDLFVCEDGPGEDRLVRITPEGRISPFARNRLNESELAGAVFSPDGSMLFVNMQETGVTLAIAGPWRGEG